MRYIAAADAALSGCLPLPAGRLSAQTIAQDDHLPLLVSQHAVHRPADLLYHFPVAHPFQKILLIADHIHQRQRRPVVARFYVIGKGHILAGLPLGPEIHQDLVFHTAGGIGGQPCALGWIKGGDALDQPDGTDGYQILLVRNLGIVFFEELMLAGGDRGE